MNKNSINVDEILNKLNIKEKASLCSGFDFWTTKKVKGFDFPNIRYSDGPHGLRREKFDSDDLGMKQSFKSTSFPPFVNIGSTWDKDLAYQMGEALANECKDQHVSVLLGPGINIKRSPLCGRNFEYCSEDPLISGKLAANYINGCQSNGIGTSLKHFCVNNQESRRMTINSLVDERALREIYLKGFEIAVKESQPYTIMCSYNKVNNTYMSDNKKILNDILRKEWGYKGLVISDWNAVNDRVEGIKAGMDLEMPSSNGINDKKIVKAIKNGTLSEEELNISVKRNLDLINKTLKMNVDILNPENNIEIYKTNHKLARKIARESFVLLKNEKNSLPLSKKEKICVIGTLADKFRYQGSGSSKINPYNLVNFLTALKNNNIEYDYEPGYTIDNSKNLPNLEEKALKLSKKYSKIIYFLGLTDSFECEGFDRTDINLPKNQIDLLEKLSKENKNINVVLLGGSPVDTSWSKNVNSILNAYLPGEAGGEALYDIIFGDYSPCGKLAETYPIKNQDNISAKYYQMGPINVEHRESIYVGYRYFDSANKDVAFPFGYGLTYTNFKYKNLNCSNKILKKDENLKLSFEIENIGNYDAKEIVQIYIEDNKPNIYKPKKELKAFEKKLIKKETTQTISLELKYEDFAYYSKNLSRWAVNDSEYTIHISSSSNKTELKCIVKVEGNLNGYIEETKNQEDYFNISKINEISDKSFYSIIDVPIIKNEVLARGKMTINNTIGDLSCCSIGKKFLKIAPKIIKKTVPNADFTTMLMIQKGMIELPLRGLVGITSGLVSERIPKGLLSWANKKRIKGIHLLITGGIKCLFNLISLSIKNKKYKKECLKTK